LFEYQIVTVSVDMEKEGFGWMGRLIDSLEKIVKEEVKKGWRPIGGISWSPADPHVIGNEAHVSQAMEKESRIPGSKIVRKTRH